MIGRARDTLLWAVLVLGALALGCGDDAGFRGDTHDATANDQDAATPVLMKKRTVRVDLSGILERTITEGSDGELVWGPLVGLGGVEVCLWKRRPLLASFDAFVQVEDPCQTSDPSGSLPPFEGLPASSELVFRATKDGFNPVAITFVTYEDDYVPPGGVPIIAMLRVGASEPWLEPPGTPDERNGVAAVYAIISGTAIVMGGPQLGIGPLFGNATPADGVEVAFEPLSGGRTHAVTTRSDRPRWLVLPEGEYRVSFNHPRAPCFWFAQHILVPASGYPTAETGVVRVPVFAGYDVVAAADCLCDADRTLGAPSDLASCSFTDADP